MAEQESRTHEVTFCSRVAGWANELFRQHPEWPFRRAEIEESRAIHRKRADLRFYGDAARLILGGEAKMPARSSSSPGTSMILSCSTGRNGIFPSWNGVCSSIPWAWRWTNRRTLTA